MNRIRKPKVLHDQNGRCIGSSCKTWQEFQDDFWKCVRIVGLDQCWEWTGRSIVSKEFPYGTLNWCGKRFKSHRLAYEVARGVIPFGLCVLHRCDNPRCCNPVHLFIGTKADNARDKQLKNRASRLPGSLHGMSKLDEAQIARIRQQYARLGESESAIGRRFGVSQSTVSKIIFKQAWKHI